MGKRFVTLLRLEYFLDRAQEHIFTAAASLKMQIKERRQRQNC
jgi:hypothetical protein